MSAAPKEDPGKLELRARPQGIRRLNRRVIAVLAGLAMLVVLLTLLWGLRDASSGRSKDTQPQQNVERVARAEGLASLPRDYASFPKTPQLGPPLGELGRVTRNAERDTGLPERSGFRPDPEEEALRQRRMKEQAEADQASKAPVLYKINRTQASRLCDASVTDPPTEHTSDSRLQGLALPLNGAAPPADPNKQDRKQAFADQGPAKGVYASGTLQAPRSPYQLMAGSIIPAALLTGIKSDLPGQVIATVTENVFDTVTGKALLIPQGSKLLGEYDSEVAFGQRRILLVWTRLLRPDGSSIVLDRVPATDAQGYAGVEDKVDWHGRRLFAGAAVSTLLGAGAELAAPERRGREGAVIIAMRESIQDSINEIGSEITRRNLDVQPTLIARPGLPVRAIVSRDLILQPYKEAS